MRILQETLLRRYSCNFSLPPHISFIWLFTSYKATDLTSTSYTTFLIGSIYNTEEILGSGVENNNIVSIVVEPRNLPCRFVEMMMKRECVTTYFKK